MRVIASRLVALFKSRRLDARLDAEVRAHLDRLADDYVSRGMTREEARVTARRAFGGIEQMKERHRDQRGGRWAVDLQLDLRYAVRTLVKAPAFTTAAVLTLALGIGATTAIFSVVKAVLLEPLPYEDSDRLIQIVENIPAVESLSGAAVRLSSMNADEFDWWRTRTKTLSHMAVLIPETRTMMTPDGTVRLPAARVSPALFPMLGIQPALGRWLRADEERPDAGVVVLSTATWRRYFGSDPNVTDRTVVLDGRSYAVVGVMPPELDVPGRDTALWMPHAVEPPRPGVVSIIRIMSRLRDGVSMDAAAAEANVLGHQLRGFPPDPGTPPRFEVVRTQDQMVAGVKAALRVLVVGVGVVLLIVCSNVANLLLVRGAARQREIVIRRALGAGRGRVIRQLLTESVVLSAAGGVAGAALALGAVRLLKALTIVDLPAVFSRVERVTGGILPRVDQVGIDGGVLAFAFGVSTLTGVLFGVVPAVRTSSVDQRQATGAGALSTAPGMSPRGRNRAGHLLAIAQLGMATTLLVAAGLLMHSFVKLSTVQAGFDPEGVLHFQLVLPQEQALEQKLQVADEITARLQSLPQVDAVGFTNSPPLENLSQSASFLPPGMTDREFLEIPRRERIQARSVSAGYLRAMGVRLIEGRWLDERDRPGQPRVVLVNRAYARRYLGGRSPIGIVLRQGIYPVEIVGLVDDLRMRTLDGVAEPAVFADATQTLSTLGGGLRGPALETTIVGPSGAMSFAVRVNGNPLSISSDLRTIVRQVDPAAAVEGVAPMESIVSGTIARPRFYAVVLSVFAMIAGVLAVIGVYGVLAYAVTQRTQEIGIRLALGAEPRTVRRMILEQGSAMVAIGIVAGVGGAAWLTRYLEGLLFGLTALDPVTYVLVATAFAATALVACYVPARRATKVDPVVALRYE